MAKGTIYTYPSFNEIFEMHTDASDQQLGTVISQNGKPIAFYSNKLSGSQRMYTTPKPERLIIVETLKDFRYILLGKRIKLFTDNKNLCHESELKTSQSVMTWRLSIEEYGPEIVYVK